MSDAALSADLSPAVLEWSRGLAGLSPGQPPCPGFKPEDWIETLTNARRFVDNYGAEADRLGWDSRTLFSVHPKSGAIRADWCGVLMPCLYPVREVTEEFLRVHLWRCQRNKPGRYGVSPSGSSRARSARCLTNAASVNSTRRTS